MISDMAVNHTLKTHVRLATKCPICGQEIQFGVERPLINRVRNFPFPHIVIHGTPLHAVIAYIDAEMQVRAVECSESLEILREGATFNQILQKWSNPF